MPAHVPAHSRRRDTPSKPPDTGAGGSSAGPATDRDGLDAAADTASTGSNGASLAAAEPATGRAPTATSPATPQPGRRPKYPRHSRIKPPTTRQRFTAWGIPIGVAAAIAIVLRIFVVGTFSIPSPSMTPTLKVHDRIVVDKLSQDMGGIHRGDIVVFRRTAPILCGEKAETYLVKRVVGVPGDHLSSNGNTILVDGKPLSQPWLPAADPLGPAIAPTTVPPGKYYVLGDNRSDSCDSRYWGDVPKSHIVGRVVARYWPLSRIHFF